MNKICVYAICKDEMKYIDAWLTNMSEADYIVVLDTGSTDGTYEFLKSDPRCTRVEQQVIHPWRFDVARNEAMKLVPDDANILLSTDIDELFDPGWGDIIRQYWTESTMRGHYTYVHFHTNTGLPGDTFIYDKLHTRDYIWVFPVHEVLLPKCDEDPGYVFGLEPEQGHVVEFGNMITLHHYPDPDKSRSSYLPLLEQRAQEFSTEPNSLFLLGREYAMAERYTDAITWFNKALATADITRFPVVKNCVLGYMGDIYAVLNNTPLAIYYYMQQIVDNPTYREPYINIAEIYTRMGLNDSAIAIINEGIARARQHFDWSERQTHWAEKPYDILSVAYYNLGDLDNGIYYAIKALQYSPLDSRIQKNYLAMMNDKKSNKS